MAEQLARLMDADAARAHYDLRPARRASRASDVDQQLTLHGIADIAMSLSESDFSALTASFDACIDDCPKALANSYYIVDERPSNSAGYVRKERKINQAGRQIEDPKSLYHFTETARDRWTRNYRSLPATFKQFLASGFEIQEILVDASRQHIAGLEASHPNISKLYYPPEGPESLSFLRVLSYDGYNSNGDYDAVAKPHFDVGGVTIQAYADALGFWGAKDGPRGERRYFDTAPNTGFMFLGVEHAKIYGDQSYLKPLWHGVDRVTPAGVSSVPKRHAVILFTDAPRVDYQTTNRHTSPDIVAAA